MDKLYIIIPAYNEEENIEQVIESWYKIVEKYSGGGESRLIIIDDGSKDNTYEIMCRMKEGRPLFLPMSKENSGHGATLLYGYEYAIEHGADYIFQTDSDGQTLPEEFHSFWEEKEAYHMVIGHRNKREDGISRIFVTKMLKLVIGCCFGVNVTDANTPFRLMRAVVLQEYMKCIPVDFNLPNVLIAVIYKKMKLPVKYIPVTFLQRQGGVNSINLRKISRIGIQAVKDFMMINKALNDVESRILRSEGKG